MNTMVMYQTVDMWALRLNTFIVERYDDILKWIRRIAILLTFFLLFGVAFAQGPNPPTPTPGALGDTDVAFISNVFIDLAGLIIKILYVLLVLAFVVGSVKSGVGAQVAQQLGAPGQVSIQMYNLIGGLVLFVVGIVILPLANMLITKFSVYIPATVKIPVPAQLLGGG